MTDSIFNKLSPQSIEIFKAINPKYKSIEKVSTDDVIVAISEIDPNLMELIKDVHLSSKSKGRSLIVNDWLSDAYAEAYVSNSETVDAYHLVCALLMQVDRDAYYKAKKDYPNQYKFTETVGLKPYYEDFSNSDLDSDHVLLGRENEITRLIVNLTSSMSKPSLLIGGTGVGKTTLMIELAKRIRENKVPEELKGAKIVRIYYNALFNVIPADSNVPVHAIFSHLLNSIAGANSQSNEKIILFIDDIKFHGNVFIGFESIQSKDNKILLVGAVDDMSGKVWSDMDNPIYQMWDVVEFENMSDIEYKSILSHHAKNDSRLSKYSYTEDSIQRIIDLHKNELAFESLPGNAIKTLELVGVYKEFKADSPSKKKSIVITDDDVEDFVGISQDDSKVFSPDAYNIDVFGLEKLLKTTVIGQDEAVDTLARALRISSMKLVSNVRPIGTYLFLGPTGVGKTYTAKQLAAALFGYRDKHENHPQNFLRIDMSEYSEKHTVSKLFGAPPGYVGYDDASALIDYVSENPKCVVLFDEIDKAHPNVLNSLLHIMEEGELRSNTGEMVSFEDTIIVMTSNHGAELIGKNLIGIDNTAKSQKTNKEIKTELLAHLKDKLKPEFLNRFDDIIVFKQLTDDNLLKILDVILQPMVDNLSLRGIKLIVSKRAKSLLLSKSNQKEYGARELKRVINKELTDSISQILHEKEDVTKIRVSTKGKDLKFTKK